MMIKPNKVLKEEIVLDLLFHLHKIFFLIEVIVLDQLVHMHSKSVFLYFSDNTRPVGVDIFGNFLIPLNF